MWARSRADELAAALMLLTRLPAWPIRDHRDDLVARAVWAYPLVGGLVGAIGGGVYAAASWIGLPALAGALLGLAATVLATGCFHEDGFADFCDGVGGGRTRERKLEIMRDSRIGAYGAAAMVLSFGLRAASLAAITEPATAACAWIAAGSAGRSAALLLLGLLPPARADGLASTAARPPVSSLLAGGFIAISVGVIALRLGGLVLWAIAMAGGLVLAVLSRRHLGGYTGDALGAAAQAGETAALLTAAALWSAP
jgi:adenosylcobinamide-GDP ribazoletransferase